MGNCQGLSDGSVVVPKRIRSRCLERSQSGRGVLARGIRRGEVRNPEGRNQYTYRRELETKADELLKGELSPEQIAMRPEWVRDPIEPGMTRGGAIAATTIAGALRGERPYYQEALKRVWPVEDASAEPPEAAKPWWEDLPDVSHFSEEAKAKIREAAQIELMRPRREREGGDDDDV